MKIFNYNNQYYNLNNFHKFEFIASDDGNRIYFQMILTDFNSKQTWINLIEIPQKISTKKLEKFMISYNDYFLTCLRDMNIIIHSDIVKNVGGLN